MSCSSRTRTTFSRHLAGPLLILMLGVPLASFGARGTTGPVVVIDSVSPDVANQGATLDVAILGSGLANGSTVEFGPGIMVNMLTFHAAEDRIDANITVAANAQLVGRVITVTDPNMMEGTFSGFYVAPGVSSGDVLVTPMKVGFGNTTVGSKKARIITVRNQSQTEPLTVLLDGPFSPFTGIGTSIFQLVPGQKLKVKVGFRPTKKGRFESEFIVVSSDKEAPRTDIPVAGRGR